MLLAHQIWAANSNWKWSNQNSCIFRDPLGLFIKETLYKCHQEPVLFRSFGPPTLKPWITNLESRIDIGSVTSFSRLHELSGFQFSRATDYCKCFNASDKYRWILVIFVVNPRFWVRALLESITYKIGHNIIARSAIYVGMRLKHIVCCLLSVCLSFTLFSKFCYRATARASSICLPMFWRKSHVLAVLDPKWTSL